MKKIASIILATALLFSLFAFPANAEFVQNDPEGILFRDDFDGYDGTVTDSQKNTDMLKAGWDTIVACSQCLNGTDITVSPSHDKVFIATKATETWKNYSVQADLTFGDEEMINDCYAAVSARSSGRTLGGYELQLYFRQEKIDPDTSDVIPASTGVRIVKRADNDKVTSNLVISEVEYPLDREMTYQILLKVNGSKLTGYVDGIKVVEGVDTDYTSGQAGIRSLVKNSGVTIKFDNFVVYAESEEMFSESFDYADANSAYYGMVAKGWDTTKTGCTTVFDPENQEITIAAKNTYFSTQKAPGALAWNDYSVSADVTLSEGTLPSKGNFYAGIAGRVTSKNLTGYEFSIFTKTNTDQTVISNGLRLEKRNNADGTIKTTALKEIVTDKIVPGETYNLKMTFVGNSIYCFVNDQLALFATDNDYVYGYAAIRSLSVAGESCDITSTFDNFLITKIDPLVGRHQNAYFADGFYNYGDDTRCITELQNGGWTSRVSNAGSRTFFEDGYLNVANPAGDTVCQGNFANTLFVGDDYSVEADVSIDSVADTEKFYASIVGRIDPNSDKPYAKNGYEFAIASENGAGKARITVLNGTTVTSLKRYDFKSFVVGQVYHLKLSFVGNTISAYIDGVQVLQVTDSTYSSGCVGIRTNNANATNTATFKNFAVINDNYQQKHIGCITGGESITADDISALCQKLLERSTEDICDVNCDTFVDIRDLVRIKQIAASY